MTRNLFIITISILFLAKIAFGQRPILETIPSVPNSTGNGKTESSLKRQMNEWLDAHEKLDFEKFLDLTHPKYIDGNGGREKMLKSLKTSVTKENQIVIDFDRTEFKEAVRVDIELFALIVFDGKLSSPTDSRVAIPIKDFSIIGISADNGANWKFLFPGKQSQFDRDFPKATGKVQIPEAKLPKGTFDNLGF